jgi:nucleotide-binding universal stress UspA family protein
MVVGPEAVVPVNAEGFEKLVFASDLSSISQQAVPLLEFLLMKKPRASVTLAHFLEANTYDVFSRHQKSQTIERKLIEMISQEFRSRIAEVIVEVSPAPEGMLSVVEGVGADLLVLGVRSGGAFTRAETHGLCSISPRVISRAFCPVLTIRGE